MNNFKSTAETNRIFYIDYLRVFATFAVVMLHVATKNTNTCSVQSPEWLILNFYNSICRWCVPVFVMISGALFLNSNYSISHIFKKNIFRIFTAFVAWSFLYAIVNVLIHHGGIGSLIRQTIQGHYHMWFLFMIIGLYLFVPLIRAIVHSDYLMKYFLIISFIFSFIFPYIISLSFFAGEKIEELLQSIYKNIYLPQSYIGYFVLGYYLYKKEYTKKQRLTIYAFSLLGFVSTIALSTIHSHQINWDKGTFLNFLTVNVLLESVGVFVFFKYKIKKNHKTVPIILKLSKYSFGVYLVHVMLIETIYDLWGIYALSIHPIISVPILTFIISIASFIISGIINHIPLLKNYIV